MKISEAFQKLSEFLRTDGKPSLDYLENLQEKFNTGNSTKLVNIVFFIIFLANIFILLKFPSAFIASALLSGLYLYGVYGEFKTQFRTHVPAGKIFFDNMINYVFPGFRVNAINLVDDEEIKNSKIFPKYYAYLADDFLFGKVDDVEINISETKLGYFPYCPTPTPGDEDYSVNTLRAQGVDSEIAIIALFIVFVGILIPFCLFKDFFMETNIGIDLAVTLCYWVLAAVFLLWWRFQGVVVDLKFNKSFAGHTIIVPKKGKQPRLNKRYEKVKLEDVEFMKKYNVYSTDQIEARYILTTAFIKRFNDIGVSFEVKEIKCSFLRNRMLIAISTKQNLFCIIPDVYSNLTIRDKCVRAFREIFSVLSIVEQLKLNKQIGL